MGQGCGRARLEASSSVDSHRLNAYGVSCEGWRESSRSREHASTLAFSASQQHGHSGNYSPSNLLTMSSLSIHAIQPTEKQAALATKAAVETC